MPLLYEHEVLPSTEWANEEIAAGVWYLEDVEPGAHVALAYELAWAWIELVLGAQAAAAPCETAGVDGVADETPPAAGWHNEEIASGVWYLEDVEPGAHADGAWTTECPGTHLEEAWSLEAAEGEAPTGFVPVLRIWERPALAILDLAVVMRDVIVGERPAVRVSGTTVGPVRAVVREAPEIRVVLAVGTPADCLAGDGQVPDGGGGEPINWAL